MNTKHIAAALTLLLLHAATAAAVVTQKTYQITGAGTYEYRPPSEGPGIPGGVPSASELDFGIGGAFDYRLDTAGPTATLLNLHLFLTGNEAIQANPPVFGVVTADRVEAFLSQQTFVEDFIGGLLHLKSATLPDLKLTDGLNGSLGINGGYNNTPVDGDAIQFQFGAVVIPEPAGIVLAAVALTPVARRRRPRRA